MQCCGVTRARNRCTNKANYNITICKADFKVCKKHQNKRLLSRWEQELYRRIISGDTSHSDPPQDVQDWIEYFHEGWDNTKNIYVSSNYATSLFKEEVPKSINFNRKFKVYVDSILQKGLDKDTCSICFDNTTIYSTDCDHKFCKSDIEDLKT